MKPKVPQFVAAFIIAWSLGLAWSVAEAKSCEQGFVSTKLKARWRHAARETHVIDQTDRLMRVEFEDHLPSEVFETLRVQDFSLLRFDSDRVSLLEVTGEGQKTPSAHFRIFSAGRAGGTIEVLPFFEAIHFESAMSRAWRRLSSVATIPVGFSSTLGAWKQLYGTSAVPRPVFELSRLLGSSDHSLVLKRELARHQSQNPGALYFAYAKTTEKARLYEDLLGLRVIEVFENPRTGKQEFILSN